MYAIYLDNVFSVVIVECDRSLFARFSYLYATDDYFTVNFQNKRHFVICLLLHIVILFSASQNCSVIAWLLVAFTLGLPTPRILPRSVILLRPICRCMVISLQCLFASAK